MPISITPFLWFDHEAEQAAEFYCSVFPNSKILEISRYGDAGPGEPGSVMVVRFTLDGNEVTALNGGPDGAGFTNAISLYVLCADQQEVDRYWSALTDGGEEIACGWLSDRFGLRWQIVPNGFTDFFTDPDPARSQAAMRAMLGMKKLDLAALEAAADAAASTGAGVAGAPTRA